MKISSKKYSYLLYIYVICCFILCCFQVSNTLNWFLFLLKDTVLCCISLIKQNWFLKIFCICNYLFYLLFIQNKVKTVLKNTFYKHYMFILKIVPNSKMEIFYLFIYLFFKVTNAVTACQLV